MAKNGQNGQNLLSFLISYWKALLISFFPSILYTQIKDITYQHQSYDKFRKPNTYSNIQNALFGNSIHTHPKSNQRIASKAQCRLQAPHYLFYIIMSLTVSVDFGGGLDLVFDGKTELKLDLPVGSSVSTVIKQLADKHANHKRDMFAINGQIRPGILVLINEADWQLLQKEQTLLQHKDRVSFISTLHGG